MTAPEPPSGDVVPPNELELSPEVAEPPPAAGEELEADPGVVVAVGVAAVAEPIEPVAAITPHARTKAASIATITP